MGQKGYSILEEHHSPESYVKILMDLIGATQRSASVALAHSLADRAGSEMSAWVDESGHDQTYRRVAEEIRLLVMG